MAEILEILLPLMIITFLGLAVWAAVSKQTIGELFRDIWDFITEKKNEGQETIIGVYER